MITTLFYMEETMLGSVDDQCDHYFVLHGRNNVGLCGRSV